MENKRKRDGLAIRPLIFGILFIAAFVVIILSIIWVDTSKRAPSPDNPFSENGLQ